MVLQGRPCGRAGRRRPPGRVARARGGEARTEHLERGPERVPLFVCGAFPHALRPRQILRTNHSLRDGSDSEVFSASLRAIRGELSFFGYGSKNYTAPPFRNQHLTKHIPDGHRPATRRRPMPSGSPKRRRSSRLRRRSGADAATSCARYRRTSATQGSSRSTARSKSR